MIKVLNGIAIYVLLYVLTACTKADHPDCGVDFVFRYDYNSEGVDKFGTEITKITLFAFESQKGYAGAFTDEGSHLANDFKMRVILKRGVYDFVAVGNLNDDFTIHALTEGVNTKEDMLIALKHTNHVVMELPDHLYHGMLNKVDVDIWENELQVMSMISLTNYVKPVITGLPLPQGDSGKEFSCIIQGANGNYLYSGLLAPQNKVLTYIPQYWGEGNSLSSEFVKARIFEDGTDKSEIVLLHHPLDGGPSKELFRVGIAAAIKAQYPDVNFDRDNEFVLPFKVDYAYGSFSISINGWVVTDSGIIVR